MVFVAVMWVGLGERRGDCRDGSGHALCRGEYIRRHRGNGPVPYRDRSDLQGAQVTAHSQGLPAAVNDLYSFGIPLCIWRDLAGRKVGGDLRAQVLHRLHVLPLIRAIQHDTGAGLIVILSS